MRVLYFHGVPFFNSRPEKNLLQDLYQNAGIDLKLWNESSGLLLREKTFQAYLDAAEQFLLANYTGVPVVLMGHSFGSHAVNYLVQKHPEKLSHVVFITSDLDLAQADLNKFNLSMQDYKKHGDDRWQGLQEVLKNYTGKFDQNTEAGFALFAQNPRPLEHFWFSKEKMAAFLPFYAEPGCGIDVDLYFGIRRSLAETNFKNSQVPAVAIFGKHDIFISQDKELVLLRERFSSLEVHKLEASAHYPHIEETGKVLGILRSLDFVTLKINKKAYQGAGPNRFEIL